MLHKTRQRGCLAELLVAYRFMEARRIPSWPLVPCAYDLVIDGGDKLYRVQVRQAYQGAMSQSWSIHLQSRRNGKTKDQPKAVTDVDIVCMVCTPERIFVIPAEACVSPVDPRYLNARIQIGAGSKYQVFLNRFAVGTGETAEVAPVVIPTLRIDGWGGGKSGGVVPRRKRHRRLTTEQITQLQALPIQWHTGMVGMDPLTVARQFDVSLATLRNLLLYKRRKDLWKES